MEHGAAHEAGNVGWNVWQGTLGRTCHGTLGMEHKAEHDMKHGARNVGNIGSMGWNMAWSIREGNIGQNMTWNMGQNVGSIQKNTRRGKNIYLPDFANRVYSV